MNTTLNHTGHVHGDDDFDYYAYDMAMEMEGIAAHRRLTVASAVVLMASMAVGAVAGGAAVCLLVRLRLWRRHEGFLYVLSLLTGNLVMTVVVFLPHWLWLMPDELNLEATSEFTCKAWRFLVNVVYSTGWYLSALLVDVYLRGGQDGGGCLCWRRLASRWCTVSGALTVNGVVTSCFVVINAWTLWKARVHVMEEGGERFCTTWSFEDSDPDAYHQWEFASICLMWFFPVCFLVPVLWALVLWSSLRRRHPGAGFSLFSVAGGGESSEFPRLALTVGALVFAVQFQMAVIDLWSYTAPDHHSDGGFVVYKVGLLVFAAQLAAVPVCCLAVVGDMRQGLRSWFGRLWPCSSVARTKLVVDEINGILALQTIDCPSPSPSPSSPPPKTVIRD